jgi:hypothetical protein
MATGSVNLFQRFCKFLSCGPVAALGLPDLTCEYGGKVDAKGKGEVDMYFVKVLQTSCA